MIVAAEYPEADDIVALLAFHLERAHENSPPGAVHALGLDALQAEDVTFWTARQGGVILGFGALRVLEAGHGEVKSMRTAPGHERKGVGTAILEAIMAEARARGYKQLSLETGNTADFESALRLYSAHGFSPCEPFGSYSDTSFSQYMTLML